MESMKKSKKYLTALFVIFFCFTACQTAFAAEKKVQLIIPACGS